MSRTATPKPALHLFRGFTKNSSDRMAWYMVGTPIDIERWVKRRCGNVAKSTRTTKWVVFDTEEKKVIPVPDAVKRHEDDIAAWLATNHPKGKPAVAAR